LGQRRRSNFFFITNINITLQLL